MEFLLINILLASVPAIVIIVYIYRKDQGGKEPRLLVFMAFVIGFFAVIPAAVIEILFAELGVNFRGILYDLFRAFVVAGLVEEGVKLIAVRLFLFKSRYFDEITDGILYTITASLGFAFFENILYSFGPPFVLIARGITAVPLHASASGILGYFIGVTKATGKNRLLIGLSAAVLIHGFYDFLLFTESWPAFFIFPLLAASVLLLRRLYKLARRRDLEYRSGAAPAS
ncbi:MAG: PrsW family intramembrane metalloprotease [Spirochaetales bacterium]|nr:PrsW family intramembrane metalloprotease [Spirochaetales bacterium]